MRKSGGSAGWNEVRRMGLKMGRSVPIPTIFLDILSRNCTFYTQRSWEILQNATGNHIKDLAFGYQ